MRGQPAKPLGPREKMTSWKALTFHPDTRGEPGPHPPFTEGTGACMPHWREMAMMTEVLEPSLQLRIRASILKGHPTATVEGLRMTAVTSAVPAWTAEGWLQTAKSKKGRDSSDKPGVGREKISNRFRTVLYKLIFDAFGCVQSLKKSSIAMGGMPPGMRLMV
jgi:hypothetical protein